GSAGARHRLATRSGARWRVGDRRKKTERMSWPAHTLPRIMRTPLQLIQKTMQRASGDRLADTEARLGSERAKAGAAAQEVQDLEQRRRLADDYDQARAVDEAVARARWVIERAEAVIPRLEAERDAAHADC